MKDLKDKIKYYFNKPPGTYLDVSHNPYDIYQLLEIAILNEHRHAFYFWNHWINILKYRQNDLRPNLITIDWHNDLTTPNKEEKKELKNLDLNNNNSVNFFTNYKLHPQNDGHICAALYCNLIQDVFVLSKQENDEKINNYSFSDQFGDEHKIFIYQNLLEFEENINYEKEHFLDIDLDYFIESEDCSGEEGKLMDINIIKQIINPKRKLFKEIYRNLKGFTIAREPYFCGGLANSNKIMDIINNNLFNNTLITKNITWNIDDGNKI